MDKRTVVNLVAGQEYELRSPRGIRVSYPAGKPSTGPTVVVSRDLGTWVEPVPPPVEPPPVEPPPVTPPPPTTTLVSSIVGLLAALDDNTVTDITVKNGTYTVAGASSKGPTSLWIGAKYADRTNPVTIHAETKGGVTFSGAGATYWIGLTFVEGAHHQTWDGFNFANATPLQTGVIVFGATYGTPGPQWAGAHHITLRNIKIMGSITSAYAGSGDHSIYFSESAGGVHDILIDGYSVDGSGGVNTALTFYHSDNGMLNAWNVTVRNMTVTGTHQAVEIWDDTLHDIVIEDATITNATKKAVRVEQSNASSDITLRRITSTNSGGFYSGAGANPPGVTFEQCSFG